MKLLQKFSLIPFVMFCLSMIGARGPCWWDDYHVITKVGWCGDPSVDLYKCSCKVTPPNYPGYCKWPAGTLCARFPQEAQKLAVDKARQKQDWFESTDGYVDPKNLTISCNCWLTSPDPQVQPLDDDDDSAPLCSDLMAAMDAPSCLQYGEVCDANTDCCSGICSLSVCE